MGKECQYQRLTSKFKILAKWRSRKIILRICKQEGLPKSTCDTISWGNISICMMALGGWLPECTAFLPGFCQFDFGLPVCCVASSCRSCYCGAGISGLVLPDIVNKWCLVLCIAAARALLPLQHFVLASRFERHTFFQHSLWTSVAVVLSWWRSSTNCYPVAFPYDGA